MRGALDLLPSSESLFEAVEQGRHADDRRGFVRHRPSLPQCAGTGAIDEDVLPSAKREFGLGRDGVQLPLVGNSLEFVGAAVIEGDTRADHGVPDGLRDEDLVGPCERADSGSDVNGDAAKMLNPSPARSISLPPKCCSWLRTISS